MGHSTGIGGWRGDGCKGWDSYWMNVMEYQGEEAERGAQPPELTHFGIFFFFLREKSMKFVFTPYLSA